MTKIVFLQTEWDNQILLDHFSKMTPKRSGKWKNMIGVTSIEEADYCVIIDYTTQEVPSKKAIYVGAHPPVCSGYYNFDNKECIAKLDLKDTFGLGEWWLKMDYDELSGLKPFKKSKDLTCILSNQRAYDYHKKRIEWLCEYSEKYPIDLYGRIKIGEKEKSLIKNYKGELGTKTSFCHWYGKKEALESYRYALEFDMGSSPEMGECKYYFSERFFDDILIWTLPIYYGGSEIHKFIPENAFRYLDIFKDTSEYVNGIVKSDFREKHMKALAEARYLLLNKYQIWARIYSIIKGGR